MAGLAGKYQRVAVFSRGVARLHALPQVLGSRRIVFSPRDGDASRLDAVAGWGHKPTADQAREYASRHGLPYLALEDGFLRSVGLGQAAPPLSLVVDDVGIYYDARRPSRLEDLLAYRGEDDPLTHPPLLARARALRARILAAELSKYNDAPSTLPEAIAGLESMVLVVDQTLNDASVGQGLGDPHSFTRMLKAAQQDHPKARVVVKVHPEVAAGRKRGYLAERARDSGAIVLGERVNPIALLRRVSHAYVCTSQVGFEALMAEVPVTCFGAPFYSGWGLTRDQVAVERRGRTRSLDELVAAALLLYPRYLHPLTGKRCEVETVVEHLALQREMFQKNARRFYGFGFSRWKRPFVRKYLAGPESEVRFVSSGRAARRAGVDASSTLVVWGSRKVPGLAELSRSLGVPVWRMEDGFLRSVRLGSELTPPGSLVLDSRGIYYDPRGPSDLEVLLQTEGFSPKERERAHGLRRRIVESGVSKYNSRAAPALRTRAEPGSHVVFVPGQVDDDASILTGSPKVRSNEQLLRAVREHRPDSFILYKPHPDVVIGNRKGALGDEKTALWDEVVKDASVAACLAVADEVHTMTSLVGFEALMRELPVTVWGQPFYAGWGLTSDMHPPERRGRRLSLDELVAGALIRYPRYYSFRVNAFCTPEDFVEELIRLRKAGGTWLDNAPWLVRRVHSLGVSVKEWVRA